MDRNTLKELCDLHWLKTMVGSISEDFGCDTEVNFDKCEVEIGFESKVNADIAFGEINEELNACGLSLKKVAWKCSDTSMLCKIEEKDND